MTVKKTLPRLLPLNDIKEWRHDSPAAALAYPLDSPRAARVGDPTLHDLSAAVQLLLLAKDLLTVRFGKPDFPRVEQLLPADYAIRDAIAAVIWDFDQYQIALELRPDSSTGRGYEVWLSSTVHPAEAGAASNDMIG